MLSVPPKQGPDGQLQLHASTVVLNNVAIAFTGPSGSGKTGHALALVARGAVLLADDITWIVPTSDGMIAQCPPAISGQIEARGIGILNAPMAPPTLLHLIVDLGTTETERLPPRKSVTLLGHEITVLHAAKTGHFLDAIVHYIHNGLATGRKEPNAD